MAEEDDRALPAIGNKVINRLSVYQDYTEVN